MFSIPIRSIRLIRFIRLIRLFFISHPIRLDGRRFDTVPVRGHSLKR